LTRPRGRAIRDGLAVGERVRVVVQKYGGSSVSDLGKIRDVALRIANARASGVAVVVVVSAMGNTTNELIALARQVTEDPDRRELDMLISTGERISVALLAMALHALGVPARSLTGSQSGIITDEAHADARVVAVRPDRVRSHLEAGEVVIIAGFQGVSRDREVTTLGRGGSDTTAVVMAAALEAELCEICSDVDGVWSADPRVVPSAHKVDDLGLDAALALARGGAKVLFEDAVRYARDAGVEILASATFGPGSGTRLAAKPVVREAGTSAPGGGAVAVTGDDQLMRVVVSPDRALAVATQIHARGGRIRRRIGDRVYVDLRNAHGGLDLPEGGREDGRAAMVTAVGSGLGERAELGWEVDALLGEAGVAVLASGGEGDVLWWEVPVEAVNAAVREVHRRLVAPPAG
jgi:aspartate kinase